ncbi:hypothetical protein [Neptunicella marina]|uniref:Lipoprotein n=1 Tax=Neptunicella marina TaxID=2125989 RepID=A0A8J6IQR6_9ALTE|nr:hypothetical protein [Neptunicella marina]MBC3764267.1 hypothetical protein [Neptunicella marina]
MNKSLLSAACIALVSCAQQPQRCEDILVIKEQQLECKKLQFQIKNNTNPQQVLEAQRRFDENCADLRYYRDQFDTVCKGEQTPIGETKKQDE